MIGTIYLDIYEYLFSVITDPMTIVQFVSINKEISQICRKQMEQKKISCRILVEEDNYDIFELRKIKYYRLPNGSRHGKFQRFHHNGSIETEMMYIDNEIHGVAQTWYKNGQLKSVYNVIHDQLNGFSQGWYKNGKPQLSAFYRDDKVSGLYQYWAENGQLVCESHYKEGLLNGIMKKWNDNGVLVEEINYVDGLEV